MATPVKDVEIKAKYVHLFAHKNGRTCLKKQDKAEGFNKKSINVLNFKLQSNHGADNYTISILKKTFFVLILCPTSSCPVL